MNGADVRYNNDPLVGKNLSNPIRNIRKTVVGSGRQKVRGMPLFGYYEGRVATWGGYFRFFGE